MLLKATGLRKSFDRGRVKALRGVSFSIERGKTLGIAGESGSGKSTLAKIILKLVPADGGVLHFEKNAKVQAVFQDPYFSLDPRLRVGDSLKEAFLIRGVKNDRSLDEKTRSLLRTVELPEAFVTRYPHQLSGGECQRVAIARAISTEPDLIVCDEPVSSLDLVAQTDMLNLFLKLQKDRGVSYVFISHDLKVIRHMSDEVLILKDGEVCESGPAEEVFRAPRHEFTRRLLSAMHSAPRLK